MATFLAGNLSSRGIAAGLTHFQQGVEHDNAGAVQPFRGDGGAHLRVHGEADGLVYVALLSLHLDPLDDFGLGRQFARDPDLLCGATKTV